MNADFLSPLLWHIVLTGSTQISVRPCNGTCYARTTAQGSSTPGKPVLPWISVDIFTISTGPNHDYTHSEHTRVALSPDWLHLDTFPLIGDALPQTRRLLDTWKNGCAIKASQCPGHSTGSNHDDTHSENTLVAQRADRLHLDTFSLMKDALPQTRRLLIDVYLDRRSMYTRKPYLTPQSFHVLQERIGQYSFSIPSDPLLNTMLLPMSHPAVPDPFYCWSPWHSRSLGHPLLLLKSNGVQSITWHGSQLESIRYTCLNHLSQCLLMTDFKLSCPVFHVLLYLSPCPAN